MYPMHTNKRKVFASAITIFDIDFNKMIANDIHIVGTYKQSIKCHVPCTCTLSILYAYGVGAPIIIIIK